MITLPPTVNILLAAPIDLVTIGIQALLSVHPDYQVIARVHSNPELENALQRHQPHVLIASDQFEDHLDPYGWITSIKQIAPQTRLILIGTLTHGPAIHALLGAGIDGYLHLHDPLEALIRDAIMAVIRGRPYLSLTANTEYLTSMQQSKRHLLLPLDAELQELLQLIAAGYHVGKIALTMGISSRRVYTLRQRLRERFGAETNEHLISLASAHGLTRPNR